jgi:type I protein arginine methyltransferase
MYSLADYSLMIADPVRMAAYSGALRSLIRPGDVVVDIGTGPGVTAILAVQAGAGRVYAIESSDLVHLGRSLAEDNGCADRIEFIQGISTEVELPRPADLVFSDLRGVLPLFGRHIPSIVDARTRLLATDGALLPTRDQLWAAVVEAPEQHTRHLGLGPPTSPEVDLLRIRKMLANNWTKSTLGPEQVISSCGAWGVLDYRTVTSPHLTGVAEMQIERTATAHGLVVWFDAEIAPGYGFSNAPGEPRAIYGHAFFPFPEPVDVREGDVVRATLAARLVSDDYMWRWSTRFDRPWSAGPALRLDQSQFYSVPFSADSLARGEAEFAPSLAPHGTVDRFVLERMNGRQSVRGIAEALRNAFPDRFETIAAAISHVGDLSRRYTG